MPNQISNSDKLDKKPIKHRLTLNGSYVIESNTIKEDSLFFLDGALLDEGLDGHYSVDEGRLELHISNFKGRSLTIITI